MSILAARKIFITGGTGSFGSAFVRRALEAGASRVVVFSRDELKQSQLRAAIPDTRLRCFVGDVRDRARLDQAVRGCDFVIHAAAMKRIEVCEQEPLEAVKTNIIGTQNVALAAINAGVQKAVFLSTDKAPDATTLYGMTKAVAERAWIQSNVFAAGTPTRLSATRYGNVLGSRGSVLDLWRSQRDAREPLTITAEGATRFWMTITQAVQLVDDALLEMQGGEIFVPKVPSAPILDLARAVVEVAGPYAPGHVCTGLKPGERMHETLISEDEARHTVERAARYVILPQHASWRDEGRYTPTHGIGTAYRSDTNPDTYTVEQLRRLIS